MTLQIFNWDELSQDSQAGLLQRPAKSVDADIREQVAWVHHDEEVATQKAKDLVAAAVHRVFLHAPLYPRKMPITPTAMVVGGGIAGIQSALDIADAGYQVYLVEREPTIGGRMAQLNKTFPTLDCST